MTDDSTNFGRRCEKRSQDFANTFRTWERRAILCVFRRWRPCLHCDGVRLDYKSNFVSLWHFKFARFKEGDLYLTNFTEYFTLHCSCNGSSWVMLSWFCVVHVMVLGYVKAESFWIGFLPSKLHALQDLCEGVLIFFINMTRLCGTINNNSDVKGGLIARLILLIVQSLGYVVMGVLVLNPSTTGRTVDTVRKMRPKLSGRCSMLQLAVTWMVWFIGTWNQRYYVNSGFVVTFLLLSCRTHMNVLSNENLLLTQTTPMR